MQNFSLLKLTFLTIFYWLMIFGISPTFASEVRFATWNIEWLTSNPVDKFSQSQRNKQDFAKLTQYYQSLNPHILAFQEVNDIDAMRKVVGNNAQIVLSQRSQRQNRELQFSDINQYTGFAVAADITIVQQPQDLALSSSAQQKLRFGSYIVVELNGQDVHLLSVHLKAGCQGAFRENRSCNTLKKQGQQLNKWINQRVDSQQTFIIAGDFNHNLAYPNDWFYQLLNQGVDQKLQLDSKQTEATCQVRSNRNANATHQYRFVIDHIVSYQLKKRSQAQQLNYALEDVVNYQLSDHCPLWVEYH